MVFVKNKLFWKLVDGKQVVENVLYDDNIDYYTFLRKYREKGLRQVIITSEIMIELIVEFVKEQGLTVYKIEFLEDDNELNYEIKELLSSIASNPQYLSLLTEKIKFLSERSSIDLRRVYIKGPYNGIYAPNFFVQSNGIIGVNTQSIDTIPNIIASIVERFFNK